MGTEREEQIEDKEGEEGTSDVTQTRIKFIKEFVWLSVPLFIRLFVS
jgi:hypothetical protein